MPRCRLVLAAIMMVLMPRTVPAEDGPAGDGQPPDLYASLRALSEADRRAERDIRNKLTARESYRFEGVALRNVLEALSAKSKIPVYLDETALQEEDYSGQEPVTGRFDKATVEQVLERVLPPLGLTWVIEDEVLKVTTWARANEIWTLRLHPFGSLIDLARTRSAAIERTSGVPLSTRRRKMSVWGTFDSSTNPRTGAVDYDANSFGWLLSLILDHSSGEWNIIHNGGSIAPLNDLFIVRNEQRVHEEVSGLLNAIETTLRGESADGSIVVRDSSTYAYGDDERLQRLLFGLASLSYEAKPLKEVVEDLGRRLGVQVLIDEQAIADEKLTLDARVTYHADRVTYASALRTILDPLKLTFQPRNGVLELTTQAQLKQSWSGHPYHVIHDIRDLAESGYTAELLIPVILRATSVEWEPVDSSSDGYANASIPGVLAVYHNYPAHAEVAELLAALRSGLAQGESVVLPPRAPSPELPVTREYTCADQKRAAAMRAAIVDFVAPGQWLAPDGSSLVEVQGNRVVVRHVPSIQDEVAYFILGVHYANSPNVYCPQNIEKDNEP